MANDGFSVYRWWLKKNQDSKAEADKKNVVETINSSIAESAAYQKDALRNGKPQAMAAVRTETRKAKITIFPNDKMFIGDLVTVFNENWLCVELHTDEYGVTYGEIWMCNHKFVYQDFDGEIITKDAIIDDGSYSKGNDKQLPIVDGTYKCYMSLDEESAVLYVDKRLSIDVILNQDGDPILEVGKIRWIDTKTKNYGEGSHLLYFTLEEDVYSKESDNIENFICDYKKIDSGIPEVSPDEAINSCLVIEGRDSIRIGTSRTYKANAIDQDGNTIEVTDVLWSMEPNENITLQTEQSTCIVCVPLNEKIVGTDFILTCRSTSDDFKAANKTVAVISIG